MTISSTPPKPIASFGPQLFAALIQGAKAEVRVPLPYKLAVRLVQRLHQLRTVMRKTNHEHYLVASQASISLEIPPSVDCRVTSKKVRIPRDPNVGVAVVISPADSLFSVALDKAGVAPPTLDEVKVEPETTTPEAIGDVLAAYVAGEEVK